MAELPPRPSNAAPLNGYQNNIDNTNNNINNTTTSSPAPINNGQLPTSQSNSKLSHHSSSPNVVGVHYKVGKKIGEGSFGIIYEGVNLLNSQPVAIKFEPRKTDAPQLRDEYRTYKLLAGLRMFLFYY